MNTQNPTLGTNGYPLQSGTVYGPIHSRRFGWSLGINPLPVTYKLCDFDCVYCQYGWTPHHGDVQARSAEKLKSSNELLDEIKNSFEVLIAQDAKVDVMTIAGNGEPTLHPEFLEFTRGLLKLRNHYFAKVPIGILSDSSQCHRPRVKEALELLDARYMKLDAGDEATIKAINRPRGNFSFEQMIQALHNLKGIVIQSLFVSGAYDNTKPEIVENWVKSIGRVAPKSVQVYTIDRPTADAGVVRVTKERLHEIAQLCQCRTGIITDVFE